MKKIFFLLSVISVIVFSACDYNERNFDGLDEMTEPTNKASYQYKMVDADYKSLAALYDTASNENKLAKKVGNNLRFSKTEPASSLLAPFLAKKYFTADAGSLALITYNFYEAAFPDLNKRTLTIKDYQKVGKSAANYFCFSGSVLADRTNMTLALDQVGEDGELILVVYNQTPEKISNQTENTYNIEMNKYDYKLIMDWVKANKADFVNGNEEFYFGVSAASNNFSLSNKSWNTDKYKILHNQTTITDAFILNQVREGVKTMLVLKLGKDAVKDVIYNVTYATYGNNSAPKTVAYRCTLAGDKPEFAIESGVVGLKMKETSAIFQYSANYKNWSPYTKGFYIVTEEDFAGMNKKDCFVKDADNYLPQLLSQRLSYAQPKDEVVVIYRNDNDKAFVWYSDRYQFKEGWSKYNPVIEIEEQFVYSNQKWQSDPTVVFTMVKADYQILVDWVVENHSNYIKNMSYKDTEFYFGASSNYSNFDFKFFNRRGTDPDGILKDLNDEQALAKMWNQLDLGLQVLLEKKYPDHEAQLNGMDRFYKITCVVRDDAGSSASYMSKYQCISKGKFKLVGKPEVVK